MTAPTPPFDLRATLAHDGPLPRDAAVAALDHAAQLMTSADFVDAARLYQRVIGFDDPSVTGAALVGLGEALHRLDDDGQALATWEEATRLPDNPATYTAWRNVAAARVRADDLRGAIVAYREAEKRAPAADKPEIASRLGWLSKEVGDQGAASRYFARARGDQGFSFTVGIVAITAIVSLVIDFAGQPGTEARQPVDDEQAAPRAGRAVAAVDGDARARAAQREPAAPAVQHVLPVDRRTVRRAALRPWAFLGFYLVFAAGASLMTFAFSPAPLGVGASGAIFGLFGLLVAADRIHRPILDRQTRGFLGQLTALVVFNLFLGFILPDVDNMAHIGGLLTGLVFGLLFVPSRVPAMRSLWVRPGPTPGTTVPVFGSGGTVVIRVAGLLLVAAAFVALWTIGEGVWG